MQEFEHIFAVVLDVKLLQQRLVFLPECASLVVLFLVPDILYYSCELRMMIRERSVAGLPGKHAMNPALFVDELCTDAFNISHEIRERYLGFEFHEYMAMIGHAVDGEKFLIPLAYNTRDILMQTLFVSFREKRLPSLYGKYYLDVDL